MSKLKFVFISILILIVGICVGAFSQTARFFVLALLYSLGVFLLKQNPFQKKSTGILVFILPFILLIIPFEIYALFYKSYLGLPMFLGGILGISFTLIFAESNIKKIGYSLLLFVVFLGIISFYLPNYFVYIYEEKNKILENQLPNIVLHDESNNIVDIQSFRNKITVIDFWSTSCGVCIKKFPEFEELKNEYKNDSSIAFYSLNLPNKRDKNDVASEFTNEYSFSKLYGNFETADKLLIKKVPQCMIIDKNLKIRYIGFLNTDSRNLYNNFNSIIKNIKNEK
jgi:thiol-disulfide isomerase/thioredoxin